MTVQQGTEPHRIRAGAQIRLRAGNSVPAVCDAAGTAKTVRDSAPCNHRRSAPVWFVPLLAVGTGNCAAVMFVPDGWAPSPYNILLKAISTTCVSCRSVKVILRKFRMAEFVALQHLTALETFGTLQWLP